MISRKYVAGLTLVVGLSCPHVVTGDVLPVNGSWEVTGGTADVVDGYSPTESVQIVSNGDTISCIDVSSGEGFSTNVLMSDVVAPTPVQAIAFSEPGCQGLASTESNSITLNLYPPQAPTLMD